MNHRYDFDDDGYITKEDIRMLLSFILPLSSKILHENNSSAMFNWSLYSDRSIKYQD